jgi:hypothetical protein
MLMPDDNFKPLIQQPGTLLPGASASGGLTLGNTPELVNALNILEAVPPNDHDRGMREQVDYRQAVQVVLDYVDQALSSPAGRRLYPDEARQRDDRFREQEKPFPAERSSFPE